MLPGLLHICGVGIQPLDDIAVIYSQPGGKFPIPAPNVNDNPALDASLAAIEMVLRLKKVNQFTQERFGIPLNVGISINTGETIVGNIGFEKKMEYNAKKFPLEKTKGRGAKWERQ